MNVTGDANTSSSSGSVYFQMPKDTSGFFSRGGVIFFAILYNSFTGMAEITNSYSQRPIVVRQRQYAMLRPSADILALNIVDAPFKVVVSLQGCYSLLTFLS